MTSTKPHPADGPRQRSPARRGTAVGSIEEHLAGERNALNFVRLVLASLVIIGHAAPLGGFAHDVKANFGTLAVDAFFCLSGYLVTGSRIRLSVVRYFWHRAVRIFPAFWVSLLVTGFVLAPLAAHLEGSRWQSISALRFVAVNAPLWISQIDIRDTLTTLPIPIIWNGSLWTLFYEFVCYGIAAVLLSAVIVRRALPVVAAIGSLAAACVLFVVHDPSVMAPPFTVQLLRFLAFFFAGMLFWSLRWRIPARGYVAVLCAIPVGWVYFDRLFLTSAEPLPTLLAPLPLCYLLLWLGGSLPVRLGSVNDISYGMYIYAFPVQQVLVLLDVPDHGLVAMTVASIVATVPFAMLSWFVVERNAARLRRWRTARPRRRQTVRSSGRCGERG